MAKEKNIELVRVNINLPTSLVNEVKDYADSIGINTTSAYIILLNQALEYKQSIQTLPAIVEFINAYKNEQTKEQDN